MKFVCALCGASKEDFEVIEDDNDSDNEYDF